MFIIWEWLIIYKFKNKFYKLLSGWNYNSVYIKDLNLFNNNVIKYSYIWARR